MLTFADQAVHLASGRLATCSANQRSDCHRARRNEEIAPMISGRLQLYSPYVRRTSAHHQRRTAVTQRRLVHALLDGTASSVYQNCAQSSTPTRPGETTGMNRTVVAAVDP